MQKKPSFFHAYSPLALCGAFFGGLVLLSPVAQAQEGVIAPDYTQARPSGISHSRGISENPYGYIQSGNEGGSYNTSAAVGPDSADASYDGSGSSDGVISPEQSEDSGFSDMYGLGDDAPTSLSAFIQGQDSSDGAQETRREKAIVKAALEKQQQIRDANIAQRKHNEAIVNQAAKAAAGKKDDPNVYSDDGGDDGYYGALSQGGDGGYGDDAYGDGSYSDNE